MVATRFDWLTAAPVSRASPLPHRDRYDLKSGARVALSVASVKEKPPLGPFDRLKVVTVLKRLAQCLQPLSIKELGL